MEFHLNPLKVKAVGVLDFETVAPLHVGAGGEEVRRAFLRLPTGELLVPASTWKGAFRSLTEQLARSVKLSGLPGTALNLYSEGSRGITYSSKQEFESFASEFVKALRGEETAAVPRGREEIVRALMELGYGSEDVWEVERKGLHARENLGRRMAEDYLALHCPIGRLYGNRVLAAKVRFLDSLLSAKTEVKPGVGIDRRSGRIVEGALHFAEVVPPGARLRLRLVADNLLPGEEDSKLFASTLDAVSKLGLSVGARRSVGMGMLELREAAFYLVELDRDGELAIGNPFERGRKLDLGGFVAWLRGAGRGG